MFICEKCHGKGWCPGLLMPSYGKCEWCDKAGPCADCRCSPQPKEPEKKTRKTVLTAKAFERRAGGAKPPPGLTTLADRGSNESASCCGTCAMDRHTRCGTAGCICPCLVDGPFMARPREIIERLNKR